MRNKIHKLNQLGYKLQLRRAKFHLERGRWLLVGRDNYGRGPLRIHGDAKFINRMLKEKCLT